MHPLDGSRLKIVRAKTHLESLKNETGRYLDTHPYEFPSQFQDDLVTFTEAVITVEPPGELGCIFGDCLYNLRSSLNYIAFQLTLRYAPAACSGDVEEDRRIQFPLVAKAANFKSQLPRNIPSKYSVPAAVTDIIESVQPYQAGYELLTALQDLNNKDKHRLPLLTIAAVRTDSMTLSVLGQTVVRTWGDISSIGVNKDGIGPIHLGFTGAVAPASNTSPPGTTTQQARGVNVDGEVAVFVTLKDSLMPHKPLVGTLEDIVECVANIVPRFEQFFT